MEGGTGGTQRCGRILVAGEVPSVRGLVVLEILSVVLWWIVFVLVAFRSGRSCQ